LRSAKALARTGKADQAVEKSKAALALEPAALKSREASLQLASRLIDANSHKWENKTWDLTDGITGMGGASQVATWQGGTPNCAAAASKVSTWSELKARFKGK